MARKRKYKLDLATSIVRGVPYTPSKEEAARDRFKRPLVVTAPEVKPADQEWLDRFMRHAAFGNRHDD